MSTGYTRQDTSNNISNGNVIDADDLDLEFNAVEAAFNNTAGHTHDGSTGQGAAITKVGPAQDLVVSASSVLPKASNTLDLGSPASQFKDLHIDGVANIDSLVADTADINGGTVDGTVIGATVAAAGTFSTLTSAGGTINGTTIGSTTPAAATFTTATINGNLVVDTNTLFVDSVKNCVGIGTIPSAWNSEARAVDVGARGGLAYVGAATEVGNNEYLSSAYTYLRKADGAASRYVQSGGGHYWFMADSGTAGSEIAFTQAMVLNAGGLSVSGTANVTALAIGGTTVTATATELNYVDGVTSPIQTQLNAKQPLDADLTALAALAATDGNFIVGNGTTWIVESGLTARTSLGLGTIATQDASAVAITGGTISGITDLAIADGGTGASTAAGALTNLGLTATAAEINFVDGVTSNIQTQLNAKQPLDADLTAIAALSPLDGNFIVGNGSTWVVENDVTARTSLGLGTIATQSAASVNISGGTITGITDLAIADGGTGASTAAAALVNLGLTATAAELNVLDGITASVTELNYTDGVTSAIQTQLDAKAPLASPTFTGTVGIPAATVTDGVTTTADNDGTLTTGTYTPTPVGGNMKRIVNGGAFTLAAPSVTGDYTLVIQITNNGTAGAITLSGFSKTTGNPFTTTSDHDFFVYITKCNGFTLANVVALQ